MSEVFPSQIHNDTGPEFQVGRTCGADAKVQLRSLESFVDRIVEIPDAANKTILISSLAEDDDPTGKISQIVISGLKDYKCDNLPQIQEKISALNKRINDWSSCEKSAFGTRYIDESGKPRIDIQCMRIDSQLLEIANSDLPVDLKRKIMGNIETLAENLFLEFIEKNIGPDGSVPSDIKLPLTATYVLNPEAVIKASKDLRHLKYDIKSHANEIAKDANLTEEEQYQAFVPKKEESSSADEMIKVLLSNDTDSIYSRDLAIAKLQLLRIYREYLNLQIASNLRDESVSLYQRSLIFNSHAPTLLKSFSSSKPSALSKKESALQKLNLLRGHAIRLGDSYNDFTRTLSRLDLFKNGYLGKSTIRGLSVPVAINPEVKLKLDQGGEIYVESSNIVAEIDEYHRKILKDLIELHGNEEFNAERTKMILESFLGKLGLLTEDKDLAGEQLSAAEKKGKPVESCGYIVRIETGKKSLSFDSKYKALVIGSEYKGTVSSLLSIASTHEIGHLLQKESRVYSIIPGFEKISGGRSELFAERGGLRAQDSMESIIKGLIGNNSEKNYRELVGNRYHYDALMEFINGGNFWDVLNKVLPAHLKKSGKYDLKNAFRRTMRVYRNYGAVGDFSDIQKLKKTSKPQELQGKSYNINAKSHHSFDEESSFQVSKHMTILRRNPTTTSLLSYLYASFFETLGFSQQPFYYSGIPGNRMKAFGSALGVPKLKGLDLSKDGPEVAEKKILKFMHEKAIDILDEYFKEKDSSESREP